MDQQIVDRVNRCFNENGRLTQALVVAFLKAAGGKDVQIISNMATSVWGHRYRSAEQGWQIGVDGRHFNGDSLTEAFEEAVARLNLWHHLGE